MSKTVAENRFDQARKRLSAALRTLEEVTKEKLHEAAGIESRILNSENSGSVKNQMMAAEQSGAIQNLTNEISRLENNLLEASNEAEALRNQHNVLMTKLYRLYKERDSLVEAIENDLLEIERVTIDGGKR